MSDSIEKQTKKVNLKKITIYIIIGITILSTLILLVNSLLSQQRENQLQSREFKLQLNKLNQELKRINGNFRQMTKKRDSLQSWVNYYQPMRAVIYNAKLRDRVMDGLDFKPGDVARFKVDSTTAVIVEIKVGGNDLNYYVNYLVKNRKGLLVEVSPFELFKP